MANSIVRAFLIACKAHKGQKDRGGKPYIFHPLNVAIHSKGKDAKIVALMHDVVEDSDMSLCDIKGFSKNIMDALDVMTHRKYVKYMTYIEVISENPLAKKVKMKDLEHNMQIRRIKNPTYEDFERVRKYIDAYEYLMSH